MEERIPYIVTRREDTGTTNGGVGMGLFLAAEAMFYGSLAAAYTLLRLNAEQWPGGEKLSQGYAVAGTLLLVAASGVLVAGRRKQASQKILAFKLFTVAILCEAFSGVQFREFSLLAGGGLLPSTHNFFGLYFLFAGFHAFQVAIAGAYAGPLALFAVKAGADLPLLKHRVALLLAFLLFLDGVWIGVIGLFYFPGG